jgi:hypothetical protein
MRDAGGIRGIAIAESISVQRSPSCVVVYSSTPAALATDWDEV